ncbi:MAG: NAD-binding protein [Haloferacaceae archaeon]
MSDGGIPGAMEVPARDYLGVGAAVLLAFAVAALSVATGLANIGDTTVTGPLARYVPTFLRRTAGFTGALTGFLMLASTLLLRRGYRVGWLATLVLLPVTAAQGLLQASAASFPLVVLSILGLPALLANRRRFDREFDPSPTQLAAVAALVGAQAYGTLGAYALREQFTGIDTLTDAFYFTVVTGTTVGYGDITPQTEAARLFGTSLLLVSVSSFAVALGVLLTPAIEARLTRALGRMTETQLDLLEDHVLVLGYGDLTEPVVAELLDATEFVVITPEGERARALGERGVDVLTGDPSDEGTLDRAGIGSARAVVAATNDDAADALAILTARQLNPDVRIVAAATHRENVNKLRRAGANTVISPATIGGRLLVRSALGDRDAEAEVAELSEELMGPDS